MQYLDSNGTPVNVSEANPMPVQLTSESVDVEVDTDELEARIGATDSTAAAADNSTAGLNGLIKRLLARVTTLFVGPATGTHSSVNSAASDTTLLASNANRKGACFTNDDANACKILLANATASATAYSVSLPGNGGYYELPVVQGGVYTGIVKGIWDADGSGAMRVTEFT